MKYAITGGIGAGKSFVSRYLLQYGIEVYDCDKEAKRLMATDKVLQRRLSDAVGEEIFPNGVLSKDVLTRFLLSSPENNAIINSIVHPSVANDFLNSGKTWMESAILFEANFERYVDKVVCVTAPYHIRLQRIVARDNIISERAKEWIERQMPQEEKALRSDYIILNDGITPIAPQIERIILQDMQGI